MSARGKDVASGLKIALQEILATCDLKSANNPYADKPNQAAFYAIGYIESKCKHELAKACR